MTTKPMCWPAHESGTVVTGAGKWLDAVSSGFLPLEVRPERPRDFWGRIDSRTLGSARTALISSQAHEVRRTRPLVERSERNHLKALWVANGRCEVEQGANRSVLESGQWAVYETGRPYSIRFSGQAHFAVALLPIDVCADWCVVGQALCARALQLDPASRGAFYTLLSSFESALSVGAQGFDALGRAMAMMVSESLQAQASIFLPADRQDRRLRDAQRLVQARLGDPALGPQDLAEALHVSLRSVYSLFRQLDTTPASYIQAERLARCRGDLADPALRQRTITEIALANGFADSAHFSRLFKARFGVTASEWRQRAG
ncbi:helix-turn-helix domain-containing protein [Zoogloea sp.]|uniref:helix-turn-helix domain-containing protein n=1 Tax=Zoogloea sp. TaxID=49181 RepID=UPI00141564FD|nr:MAG: helix-turn-helix domain-containing protein [Zoogloea sp.]